MQTSLEQKLTALGCHLAANLTDKLTTTLHRHLNTIWNVSPDNTRFMAPFPVSLTRARMASLREEEYVAALKTDGQRVCLYFCATPDPTIVVFGRDMQFIQLRGEAPAEHFRQNGTLLDGELTATGELVLFDAVYAQGCSLMQRNYIARMKEAERMLEKLSLPGLELQCKRLHPISHLDALQREMETDAIASDGIVFTPVNRHLRRGSDRHLFKYKSHPTVDLLYVSKPNSKIELQWKRRDVCESVISPRGMGLTLSYPGLDLMLREPGVHEFLVRLTEDKQGFLLEWFRSRTGEKSSPNYVDTVCAVFDEVLEEITLVELSNYCLGEDSRCAVKPQKFVTFVAQDEPARVGKSVKVAAAKAQAGAGKSGRAGKRRPKTSLLESCDKEGPGYIDGYPSFDFAVAGAAPRGQHQAFRIEPLLRRYSKKLKLGGGGKHKKAAKKIRVA